MTVLLAAAVAAVGYAAGSAHLIGRAAAWAGSFRARRHGLRLDRAEQTLSTPVPTYRPTWARRRTGGL
ncbi:hypothetical protein [Streptomyces kronopolitis]|uniref:hypothetical protein n=1 Tax=Streptomyces kronopolitis TaxID=1612435 RepID=UPI003D975D62